ncbi:MOSC domain-containing protein [Modestobacter sp. VKM Ac-2983]|uniref:MOSC domain-containing protein n=1 Tax=Modestobacter sp. VKM Ac-2983 TaxID=3004137 RepID=UPI0022AB8967|nr:MOSC domain-containing protein [Modestobacter sp. VKM Ac-2983]MCZ2804693.1 MOSC domain-containing protein [Modestobacter sp. VKM Ac-2983]
MNGRVTAVCVSGADLLPLPDKRPNRSGIRKSPVEGRVAVHPLGLEGDVQVNKKHHGGEGQAVYAYAQEDADWWVTELDRELPPGRFGENLRTVDLDLVNAVIGEQWRVGTALVQVTAWRTPCANFARYWGVPDLVKRFSARGATGAYLRVLETGEVGAGDAVTIVSRPDHGITVAGAFRIVMTEKSRLPELTPVLPFLADKDRPVLAAKIDRVTARA